jgi:hypothetical protein
MLLPCPACGAEVKFKNRSSLFQVCSFCTTMLVRTDVKLESIGKMAQLAPDMSLIQIGTRGKFKKSHFEVIGKQRMEWEDGAWNEWYVYFDDGKDGWLAEAQGFFMVSFLFEGDIDFPEMKKIKPGQTWEFGHTQYIVDDIKVAKSLGGLGELPVETHKGKSSSFVDLSGPDDTFASIDYSGSKPRLYMGSYFDFDDFEFENLKELDGW